MVDVNAEIQRRLKQMADEVSCRPSVIDQVIADIADNEWYCDQGGSESEMLDWEKELIIAGLKRLLED